MNHLKDTKKPLNNQIRAKKVQLVTDEGENLGEMSIAEAREKASAAELDLMEIGKK